MPDACTDHYSLLHGASGVVLGESFSVTHLGSMAKSHAFIADLGLWIEVLGDRSEVPVLQAALREYQFSILALSIGHYRAAFVALRLSLELCFACIQWSANERELREWRIGQRDSNWKALCDAENGILSKQFVRLFSEELANDAAQYRVLSATLYRECSEYVHGNAHTHHALPDRLVFDSVAFNNWHQMASTMRLVTSFALTARYVTDLDSAARSRLESVLLDHLGHLVGVRSLLGAPIEVIDE